MEKAEPTNQRAKISKPDTLTPNSVTDIHIFFPLTSSASRLSLLVELVFAPFRYMYVHVGCDRASRAEVV